MHGELGGGQGNQLGGGQVHAGGGMNLVSGVIPGSASYNEQVGGFSAAGSYEFGPNGAYSSQQSTYSPFGSNSNYFNNSGGQMSGGVGST